MFPNHFNILMLKTTFLKYFFNIFSSKKYFKTNTFINTSNLFGHINLINFLSIVSKIQI
jgi:hypothetical protein